MDIKSLIGETTEYDKKLRLEEKKPKSWCKTVSAFANSFGGFLVFGISDDDEIIGLKDAAKDAEKISEIIKTRLDPVPEFSIEFHKEDNKDLILLHVFKGEETPYYYSGDGSLEAYVRMGNESVKATSIELKRLVMRGKNSTFDSLVTDYDFDDYSFSKLKERYFQWTGKSFDDKLYESFGIVNSNGKLTNAGALLADETPVYQNRLFCTRWNGLTKAGGLIDALDSAEYKGGLISLLRDGESFIKRNTRVMWRKTPFSRIEMPEYVFQSASEALVNALIHRDYTVVGSEVHIDIFDDRMEIYSPGGMVNGRLIQELDIRHVPSERRNPILADIFNRLGLMERQGSGLSKIVEGYQFEENYTEAKRPVFYSDRTQFIVEMPNLNYDSSNSGTQDGTQDDINNRIISLIRANNKISAKDMANELGISLRTVRRKLSELDCIKYVGRGYSGHWEIEE
ncbi:MAG: helix-turn-helix domain-containing protein [Erysipelotrichaceae bacterium]|nr:helix-turn-helix domain-containing protein [Erysipelotrichaceae bacterium]